MPLGFFGNRSTRSPSELIRSLQESLLILEKGDVATDRKVAKAQEEVSRHLQLIKNMLYGTNETEPDPAVAPLATEIYNTKVLILLINNLSKIELS